MVLRTFLKMWHKDINAISNPALKSEAVNSFMNRFKRNFNPELLESGKIGNKKVSYYKVGDEIVHIGETGNGKYSFYILP